LYLVFLPSTNISLSSYINFSRLQVTYHGSSFRDESSNANIVLSIVMKILLLAVKVLKNDLVQTHKGLYLWTEGVYYYSCE
jgi:hypothetical protein